MFGGESGRIPVVDVQIGEVLRSEVSVRRRSSDPKRRGELAHGFAGSGESVELIFAVSRELLLLFGRGLRVALGQFTAYPPGFRPDNAALNGWIAGYAVQVI